MENVVDVEVVENRKNVISKILYMFRDFDKNILRTFLLVVQGFFINFSVLFHIFLKRFSALKFQNNHGLLSWEWQGNCLPPGGYEILPEWDSFPLPVHALHWFGSRIENGEVRFRASSKTYNCNVPLLSFN